MCLETHQSIRVLGHLIGPPASLTKAHSHPPSIRQDLLPAMVWMGLLGQKQCHRAAASRFVSAPHIFVCTIRSRSFDCCTHMNTHTRPHAHTHTYTYTHIHTHKCLRTHAHTQRTYTHAHKHIYSHTLTHTHTHTHTNTLSHTTYATGGVWPLLLSRWPACPCVSDWPPRGLTHFCRGGLRFYMFESKRACLWVDFVENKGFPPNGQLAYLKHFKRAHTPVLAWT